MKEIIKSLVCLLVIGFISVKGDISRVVAACKTSGSNTYCATAVGKEIVKAKPIYDTQVYHTKGTSTSVSVNKNVTQSISASEALGWGLSAWGVSVAGTVGVGKTKAHTTGTNVVFSLNKTRKGGFYRVTQFFPGTAVKFTQAKFPEYVIKSTKKVQYAPKKNSSYHQLTLYTR